MLVYVFDKFDIGLTQWGIIAALAAVSGGVGAYVMSNMADRYDRGRRLPPRQTAEPIA